VNAGDPIGVLLVEPDEEDARRLEDWLHEKGITPFRCERVESPAQAEEALRARPADVLLIGLRTPDMNGLATVQRLRAAVPSIPVVVTAPNLDDAVALEAVREGADDFLDKDAIVAGSLRRTLLYAVERHRLAARLSEQESRMRHTQRMETVAVLAGGVAHDFNNLLTVIRGRCELASRHTGADPKVMQDLSFIRVACDRASKLTRQLLTFSRRDVSRPRVLDVNMVVEDLEPLLRSVVGDSVALRMELDSTVGSVVADLGHVEQVVVNLAVNARDAMPDGGALTIETLREELDEEFCRARSVLKPGLYTVLRVTDTGVGMDADTQARAFEPFFTTKPMGRGTGLGLATVYGVVTEAGGEVSCWSEIGRGTTFSVYLPIADAPPDEPSFHDLQPVLGRGEVVLLVEDDEPRCASAARSRAGST
jgi:signal transduction histidine kinase